MALISLEFKRVAKLVSLAWGPLFSAWQHISLYAAAMRGTGGRSCRLPIGLVDTRLRY